MTPVSAKTPPAEPGMYVTYLLGAKFPRISTWSGRNWFNGAMVVQVQAYVAERIPNREEFGG